MKQIRESDWPTHLQVKKAFSALIQKYVEEGVEAIYLSINLEAV